MAGDALTGSPACTWWNHGPPNRSEMTIRHTNRPWSGIVVMKRVKTMPVTAWCRRLPVRQGLCVSGPALCPESGR